MNLRLTLTFVHLALAVVAIGCTPKPKAQPRVLDVQGAYKPDALVEPTAPAQVGPTQASDVGSTAGLQTSVAPAPVAGSPRSYTIVKGDTLYSIAKSHYGNGNQYLRIVEANPGLEPRTMRVGQQIVLP